MMWWLIPLVLLAALVAYDLLQKRRAILRNFPVIGHLRYLLEAVGPELRQYIVTNNDEERPFSRDERRWVYASSKQENNYFGFGTDNDLEVAPNYLVLRHSAFPIPSPHVDAEGYDGMWRLPCSKVLGGARGREHAFAPESIVTLSGMSYGSLSAPAVEALNRGAEIAGCLHNTGEGGVSRHHLHGGDLVWQIGTGYFGCRAEDGGFSRERFEATVENTPVKAVEIKLSQGAKPGLGGVLPKAKISAEIAGIRGIPRDRDCISPARHTAFSDVDEMLDFVESLAESTGLPVGLKSAVGDLGFWVDLADRMVREERGVDFVSVDGGEGGTGAGPLAFTDHVGMPFKQGFAAVYRIFAERGIADDVVWIGAGRLGFPEKALLATALGCDMVAVGREALLAIGCIQAQRCHTGHCPTGITTHNKWLIRGLEPTSKGARAANYIVTLRKELTLLSRALGVPHPAEVSLDHLEILDDRLGSRPAREVFGYQRGWGAASPPHTKSPESDRITIRLPTK